MIKRILQFLGMGDRPRPGWCLICGRVQVVQDGWCGRCWANTQSPAAAVPSGATGGVAGVRQ